MFWIPKLTMTKALLQKRSVNWEEVKITKNSLVRRVKAIKETGQILREEQIMEKLLKLLSSEYKHWNPEMFLNKFENPLGLLFRLGNKMPYKLRTSCGEKKFKEI